MNGLICVIYFAESKNKIHPTTDSVFHTFCFIASEMSQKLF